MPRTTKTLPGMRRESRQPKRRQQSLEVMRQPSLPRLLTLQRQVRRLLTAEQPVAQARMSVGMSTASQMPQLTEFQEQTQQGL